MKFQDFIKDTNVNIEYTDKYDEDLKQSYLDDIKYLNELVYSYGEVYLFIGIVDFYDDYAYIKVDSNGIIHYESCVGSLGLPLKSYMSKTKYNSFKEEFISNLKFQRNWRKIFDKNVYLIERDKYNDVEYYTNQYNCPILKHRMQNINDMLSEKLNKDERRKIRKEFFNYFMHMLGFHHITTSYFMHDETDDESSQTIYAGYCDICKRRHKVKYIDLVMKNPSKLYKKWTLFRHSYRRSCK